MPLKDYLELEGEEAFYGQEFGGSGYCSVWLFACDIRRLPAQIDWLQDLAGVNCYDLDFNATVQKETDWESVIETIGLEDAEAMKLLDTLAKTTAGFDTLLIQGDFHYDPSKVTREVDPRLKFLGAYR
jgi:hypothetical protein